MATVQLLHKLNQFYSIRFDPILFNGTSCVLPLRLQMRGNTKAASASSLTSKEREKKVKTLKRKIN